jgi:hypothetical protein
VAFTGWIPPLRPEALAAPALRGLAHLAPRSVPIQAALPPHRQIGTATVI